MKYNKIKGFIENLKKPDIELRIQDSEFSRNAFGVLNEIMKSFGCLAALLCRSVAENATNGSPPLGMEAEGRNNTEFSILNPLKHRIK
ncbi:MAG: hypothetical protein JW774_13510 [Candidatus Aureabacteria bacterium]|nr:hypothetical protein [Candidatus Auribacterota bacterium]